MRPQERFKYCCAVEKNENDKKSYTEIVLHLEEYVSDKRSRDVVRPTVSFPAIVSAF